MRTRRRSPSTVDDTTRCTGSGMRSGQFVACPLKPQQELPDYTKITDWISANCS